MFKHLRWKLAATYIGLVILSIMVLGVYALNSLEDYFYNSLKTRLESQASLTCRLLEQYNNNWEIPVMNELAKKVSGDIDARVTIINLDGVVLGDSEEEALLMENHLSRPEVQEAIEKGKGLSIRYSGTLNSDMIYFATTVTKDGNTPGFIRLALPLAETREAFLNLWSAVLVAILLAVSCAVPVSIVLGRKVTQPLERLTEFARRISRGDFGRRTRVSGNDEIGELAAALNHMAGTIEEKVSLISQGMGKLEAVLTSMSSGVFFVNMEGRVDLVNPAAEKFLSFDIKDSEVIESTGLPYDTLIKYNQLSSTISRALKDGCIIEQEVKIDNPVEIILNVIISPIKDQETKQVGVVVVLHDITEMRKLERMRTEFVANVSHELKTPVTAVKGFTETLLDGALHDRDICREFIEIIDREAERLKRLIEELLELSRLEAMQVELNSTSVDVRSIVESVALTFTSSIAEAGLRLELIMPEKPVVVETDYDMAEQVLLNLVDNAVKYTPSGGKISIEIIEREDDVVLRVKDTGIGIPPEDINRIFERFYRVDKTRSRARGGTGLGLSIVKHMVEVLRGTVGVGSVPGKGSEFYFTIPL